MRSPLFILAVATFVIADVHHVWWDITYVDRVNPDGRATRRAIGVNGTWPPPPIEVSTSDSLVVHATNSLSEPTTLHHHGMFFNTSTWYDGALDISQCGIPPGQSFDYHIPVDSSGQRGTYWVHAHSKGQYVDGLRAPLILRPPQEVHQYDEEFTVILGDWYHTEHKQLLAHFLSSSNPLGIEPIPNSGLIYFAQNGAYLPPIGGQTNAAVGFNEKATLPFQPGKKYRLRIINTSALSTFHFWIDGHDMKIIEADGTDTEESAIDVVSLAVAQRYSVLVTARNDTSSNWAIHVAMDITMFDEIPSYLNPNTTSSITYLPSSPITDHGSKSTFSDVADLSLVPIPAVALLPPATHTVELEVSFELMSDGTNRGLFNDVAFTPPRVPGVLSALTLGANAESAGAYAPSVVLKRGEVVDIVLKNGDAGNHPFHLHGHQFQLVGRSENYTSKDPRVNPPIVEGRSNVMRRDTVQVPGQHSVTLRFVADNPGVWLFHCHIEWHLQAGLAIQFIEAPLELQAQQSLVPPELAKQCQALGQPISGNAAGHTSASDLRGYDRGPSLPQTGWHPRAISAMFGCVLSAALGMAAVVWYALGSHASDAEIAHELRARLDAREQRGRFFGLFKK